jgi:HD superfamily phosphohydrolase
MFAFAIIFVFVTFFAHSYDITCDVEKVELSSYGDIDKKLMHIHTPIYQTANDKQPDQARLLHLPIMPSQIHYNKIISDVIHQSISISNLAISIIDTTIFKRLTQIKQTGTLIFKHPCATHTRFEHSIGVYHLTGIFLNNLIENTLKKESGMYEINLALSQIPFTNNHVKQKYGISNNNIEKFSGDLFSEELIEIVKIAGLIHDLGHGPYSHLFDNWLQSKPELAENPLLEHEYRSIELFKIIVATTNYMSPEGMDIPLSTFFTPEAIDFMANLIHPSPEFQNNFIFQIVSNQINGFDVDKLDYLVRDSHYIRNLVPFRYDELIKYQMVIDGKIAFPYKYRRQILDVYQLRYNMHKDYYNDAKIICVELMIKNMLDDIDKLFDITNSIKAGKLNVFTRLSDASILNIADNICLLDAGFTITDTYKRMRHITNRINNRQFYELIFDDTNKTRYSADIIEKHMNKIIKQKGTAIDASEIIVVERTIGFLSGNKPNPLKSIDFYNENKELVKHIYNTDFSNLLSNCYQESLLFFIHVK